MKYDVIVADPPFPFFDLLKMDKVKRGADANYKLLDIKAIEELKVKEIAADDSVLALWVPSSLLQDGLNIMKSWGYVQKQTHIWVKVKLDPFKSIKKLYHKLTSPFKTKDMESILDDYDLNSSLAFGMGRLWRGTHEICIVGTRGKVYDKLKNKSQRSVHFDINKRHSAKPEKLQDMLDLMFPGGNKLEIFARRARPGWETIGNQSPTCLGEDIVDSLDRLAKQ